MADVGGANAAEDTGELGGGVDVFFLFCEKFFDEGELLVGDVRGKFFVFVRAGSKFYGAFFAVAG